MELRDLSGFAGLFVACGAVYFAWRREKRDRHVRVIERKNAMQAQLRLGEKALRALRSQFAQMANIAIESGQTTGAWAGIEEQLRRLFDSTGVALSNTIDQQRDMGTIRWEKFSRHEDLIFMEEQLANVNAAQEQIEHIMDEWAVLMQDFEKGLKGPKTHN